MYLLRIVIPIVAAIFSTTISCSCSKDKATSSSQNDKEETVEDIAETSDFCYVKNGILRMPDGRVMSLWGVNFQTPLSWEANRLSKAGIAKTLDNLKKITDNNLDDIILMGATEIRCHLTPADFTDSKGNLVNTIYLESLDYLVSQAEKKGIYVSLALVNHMNQNGPGVEWVGKGAETWIHDSDVVECTKNYISQFLDHMNPYSGRAYKDATNIAFWELINEPRMYDYSKIKSTPYASDFNEWLKSNGKTDAKDSYAEYRAEKVNKYIDSMIELIRNKGDRHPVCWDLNWHRYRTGNEDIFHGVALSKAEIVALCNYPGQDYVSNDYWNNRYDFTDRSFSDWFNKYYNTLDGYGWTLSDDFADKAKITYEFETFFNQSAYLYPTQACYFKKLSSQCASMWTYTFNEIAPMFGGSHFLNLRCTPGKAASFLVAKYIFKKMALKSQVTIADEMSGNGWVISKKHDTAVYCDSENYISSGETASGWCKLNVPATIRHIAGIGNSPLVSYSGSGMYFIDDTGEGLTIKLMPDVTVVGDRFKSPDYKDIVTKLDTDKENNLSISLSTWKSAKSCLYSIATDGSRSLVREIDGCSNLSIRPGNYIIIKK